MNLTIRTLLFATIGILWISSSFAQVQKGDDLIGFSSSVSTQSSSPSSINATVLVSYERYLTTRWSLGLAPYLTVITSRGSMTGIFGGNLYANYGFITNDGKLYPYVGVIGSVSQSISTNDPAPTTQPPNGTPDKEIESSGNSTVSFYGAGAKAGTKYFVSERVNLDLNVNYATNISSVVNGDRVDYGEGGILQIFLGIGVIIGRQAGE